MSSANRPWKDRRQLLLIAGILCIAINLRPALAGVGPLIDNIKAQTGLTNSLLGLLTTLPLLAFGVVSTLTPFFTKRYGMGKTLLGAMLLLAVGIGIRSLPWVGALYVGTALLGIAIALGNVLLPSITKRNFEQHSGWVTSLYSSTMAIGAAVAAGVSVPLAKDLGLDWHGALAVWGILALVAAAVWWPQAAHLKKADPKRGFMAALKGLMANRLAWFVALFMGLQSFTFYVVLAWLPAILQHRGFDASYAGWMLSLSQAVGILGSLLVPTLAAKRADQGFFVAVLIFMEVMAIVGLLMPQWGMVALWVSLFGFVLGGTFGLALLFIVLRSRDTETATELSGMAQSVGYFVAAVGPIAFGALYDLAKDWSVPLLMLLGVCALKLAMGLGASKDRSV
ncbi:CynX/NimT family MFS transporter [Maribacter sp. 2307ULW6-5]|uniref:CynX/NimT family MFS transporter n=1 Tax=Maribacter sp. 2307ULW6-5 TaxID=3386275 RepID=UPI0039BC2ADE